MGEWAHRSETTGAVRGGLSSSPFACGGIEAGLRQEQPPPKGFSCKTKLASRRWRAASTPSFCPSGGGETEGRPPSTLSHDAGGREIRVSQQTEFQDKVSRRSAFLSHQPPDSHVNIYCVPAPFHSRYNSIASLLRKSRSGFHGAIEQIPSSCRIRVWFVPRMLSSAVALMKLGEYPWSSSS